MSDISWVTQYKDELEAFISKLSECTIHCKKTGLVIGIRDYLDVINNDCLYMVYLMGLSNLTSQEESDVFEWILSHTSDKYEQICAAIVFSAFRCIKNREVFSLSFEEVLSSYIREERCPTIANDEISREETNTKLTVLKNDLFNCRVLCLHYGVLLGLSSYFKIIPDIIYLLGTKFIIHAGASTAEMYFLFKFWDKLDVDPYVRSRDSLIIASLLCLHLGVDLDCFKPCAIRGLIE